MRKKFFIVCIILSLGLLLISIALQNKEDVVSREDEQSTSLPASFRLRIGESQSGFGITITPQTVLEDSRCPIDVTCIQAGTVRLEASVQDISGSTSRTFVLGQPVMLGEVFVTLTMVEPEAVSNKPIASSEHQFIFSVSRE